jgi:hypothetical protein
MTDEGIAALEELRQITAIGRNQFAGWVTVDPAKAKAFVELAGPAILLLGGLEPLLRRLHQSVSKETMPSEASTGWGAGFRSDTERGRIPLPVNAFGVAALAGIFGPGIRDGLDAAFYAISEAVDRAWNATCRESDDGE